MVGIALISGTARIEISNRARKLSLASETRIVEKQPCMEKVIAARITNARFDPSSH